MQMETSTVEDFNCFSQTEEKIHPMLNLGTYLVKLTPSKYLGPLKVSVCQLVKLLHQLSLLQRCRLFKYLFNNYLQRSFEKSYR